MNYSGIEHMILISISSNAPGAVENYILNLITFFRWFWKEY